MIYYFAVLATIGILCLLRMSAAANTLERVLNAESTAEIQDDEISESDSRDY